MQGSMKNYPVKLRFERSTKGFWVIPYPVNTNIDFSQDWIRLRKVECYNVGIEIMIQELTINFQKGPVGTENVINGFELFTFFFE